MSVVAEIDAVLPRAGVEQQLPVGLLVSNVCAGAHLTATVRIGTHTAPEPAAGQRLQCHIALGAWAGP